MSSFFFFEEEREPRRSIFLCRWTISSYVRGSSSASSSISSPDLPPLLCLLFFFFLPPALRTLGLISSSKNSEGGGGGVISPSELLRLKEVNEGSLSFPPTEVLLSLDKAFNLALNDSFLRSLLGDWEGKDDSMSSNVLICSNGSILFESLERSSWSLLLLSSLELFILFNLAINDFFRRSVRGDLPLDKETIMPMFMFQVIMSCKLLTI
jgi:hypothetical protein